jgi:hypothetical protein
MLAITLSFPQQRAQASMSIPDTRFRRLAQFIATWRGVAGLSVPSSACSLLPLPRPAGVTAARSLVTASWFFLARVEVMAPAQTSVIVAVGDSLTDGTASTIDTNNRWPNHLARRLLEDGQRMAVLNAGIGGNRMLVEGTGPAALARFDRDVLSQPGVSHVVVFEGINDIGQARPTTVLGKYDAGDRLHLNAAGYEASASAIDLAVFR